MELSNVLPLSFAPFLQLFSISSARSALVNGPGSGKRDLKGMQIKIKILKRKERTGFDENFLKIIFNNHKNMSLWTCVYSNTFKNMTS